MVRWFGFSSLPVTCSLAVRRRASPHSARTLLAGRLQLHALGNGLQQSRTEGAVQTIASSDNDQNAPTQESNEHRGDGKLGKNLLASDGRRRDGPWSKPKGVEH